MSGPVDIEVALSEIFSEGDPSAHINLGSYFLVEDAGSGSSEDPLALFIVMSDGEAYELALSPGDTNGDAHIRFHWLCKALSVMYRKPLYDMSRGMAYNPASIDPPRLTSRPLSQGEKEMFTA